MGQKSDIREVPNPDRMTPSGNWHPSRRDVDFRLDLKTPVNWRDGRTERSGVSPSGPARIRTCQSDRL